MTLGESDGSGLARYIGRQAGSSAGDFHSNNVSRRSCLLSTRSSTCMHPVAFANHLALLCTLRWSGQRVQFSRRRRLFVVHPRGRLLSVGSECALSLCVHGL